MLHCLQVVAKIPEHLANCFMPAHAVLCYLLQVVAKIPEYLAEAPKALGSIVSFLVDTVNSVSRG